MRFEILLWVSGCENFSGPSRNGPLECHEGSSASREKHDRGEKGKRKFFPHHSPLSFPNLHNLSRVFQEQKLPRCK